MRMSDINAERVPSPTSPASTSSAPPAPPSVCVGITGHYRWKEDWERASESLPKPFVSVTVQNPETVGKMINKYVAYEIEPVSNESGISYGANVKRRYNDFAWLREVLVSRYVGMLIPPIPSTSVVFSNVGGNHTDAKSDYVINRMSQLNSFMSELLNNPFLRCDQSFRSFVTADDAVFKVAKESAKNSNFLTDCSEGAVLWRKLLEDVTILDTIGTSLVSLGSMTDTMLKSLDDMELACAQLARKAQSLAKEMRDYSANTVLWSENEIDLADPYKNVIGNKYSKNIGVVMNGLVVGCGHWSINTSILPRMIATVLFANIQYQIKAVHAMKELLKRRMEYIRDLEKTERELSKLLEAKETPASAGMFSSMFTSGKEADLIEDKKVVVATLTELVRYATKSFVYCEIERFDEARYKNMELLMGSLIAANVQMSKNVQAHWLETAALCGVDIEKYDEEVKVIIDSASNCSLTNLFSTDNKE